MGAAESESQSERDHFSVEHSQTIQRRQDEENLSSTTNGYREEEDTEQSQQRDQPKPPRISESAENAQPDTTSNEEDVKTETKTNNDNNNNSKTSNGSNDIGKENSNNGKDELNWFHICLIQIGTTKRVLVMWWLFIYYLVVLISYFPLEGSLWGTTILMAFLVGLALGAGFEISANKSRESILSFLCVRHPLKTFRFFATPFCVASYSASIALAPPDAFWFCFPADSSVLTMSFVIPTVFVFVLFLLRSLFDHMMNKTEQDDNDDEEQEEQEEQEEHKKQEKQDQEQEQEQEEQEEEEQQQQNIESNDVERQDHSDLDQLTIEHEKKEIQLQESRQDEKVNTNIGKVEGKEEYDGSDKSETEGGALAIEHAKRDETEKETQHQESKTDVNNDTQTEEDDNDEEDEVNKDRKLTLLEECTLPSCILLFFYLTWYICMMILYLPDQTQESIRDVIVTALFVGALVGILLNVNALPDHVISWATFVSFVRIKYVMILRFFAIPFAVSSFSATAMLNPDSIAILFPIAPWQSIVIVVCVSLLVVFILLLLKYAVGPKLK